MLQAPVLDGLSFDSFPFQQDGLAAPEVDIGGREVIQALVVAPVVVVLDEGAELGFEITGQIIVLQQDPVLEGLVRAVSTSLRQPGSAFTVATPRHRRGATTTDRAAVAAGQRPHAASRPGCRSSVLGHPGGSFSPAD